MSAVEVRAGWLVARPREVELALLLFAAGVLVAGWAVVDATLGLPVSSAQVLLGVVYFVLMACAHLAVRWRARNADPLILPCVAVLNGLGLVMIHRLDLAELQQVGQGTPVSDVWRQLIWTTVAVLAFVSTVGVLRRHHTLARYAYTWGLVGLVLLVLPGLLPASISQVNGAKLWLRVGSITIQPGEFAKIAITIFAAALLVAKRNLFMTTGRQVLGVTFPRARDLGPLLTGWGLAVGVLAIERELGASLLVFGVALCLVYVATNRASWVLLGLVFFVVGSTLAYRLFAHVRVRVDVWRDPFVDPSGGGYQVLQSLFGFGTGGLSGTGLGGGHPGLVPLANADFIMASFGEELGLIGVVGIVLIYLLLVSRGLQTALRVRDSFGKLLAVGLSFTLGWQFFIVAGGVSNLIPDTGLTTPFLSYGGSSLVANYVLVAILVTVSHAARTPDQSQVQRRRETLSRAVTEVVESG